MINIRTDLALEWGDGLDIEEEGGELNITRTRVNRMASQRIGKPEGKYTTLFSPELSMPDPGLRSRAANGMAKELRDMLPKNGTALVIGLGNRHITPDALGPFVVDNLLITRQLFEAMPEHVIDGMRPCCGLAPGVLGITGLETAEIVQAVVSRIKPAAVIAIDSLCAGDVERIGTTIQMADSGINPGSGVGNHRRALNQATLGVPVIAIGVPMVVYASTIAKAMAGQDISPKWQGDDLVVTPREIDHLVDTLSHVIAMGINLALHDMPEEDIYSLL